MVTPDVLRRANSQPAVQAIIARLAKDSLIRRAINLLSDLEPVPGQPTLLRLTFLPPNRQNKPHEISLAARVSRTLNKVLVMTGETTAIDAFCLADGQPIQLKCIQKDNPHLPPGNVVDAAKDARQSAHDQGVGWKGIWVYIESPRNVAVIRQRWSQKGTQPELTANDLDGTISKVIVYASDGEVELPLVLPRP